MKEDVKVFKFTIYKGIGALYEMHHDEEKLISFARMEYYPKEVREHYNQPPQKCAKCLSENVYTEAGLVYCKDCKRWTVGIRNHLSETTKNLEESK